MLDKIRRNKGTIIATLPVWLIIFISQWIEQGGVVCGLIATLIIAIISIPTFILGMMFANYAMNKWDEK